MSIKSQKDLLALMKIGQIVGQTLRYMQDQLRAGMTTEELDAFGADFLEKHGAQSAPRLMYKFPGTTCISINDEAAHGIPGKRVIQPGDLVNIDVSAELDGYFADTGASIPVLPIAPLAERLCKSTRAALNRAIDAARAGQPINVIGKAVEVEAKRGNFKIVRDLGGHGVGRSLHEAPRNVLNYYDPGMTTRLTEGMVLTIEPFLSTHATRTTQDDDGWTLRTPNSLVAQFEHTLVITRKKPLLITAI
jgi:methionyl aminopeptidase